LFSNKNKLFQKTVLEDSLEKRGRLNQIRAKIRSEIFSSLEDNNDQIPKLPHENLLINELIREYLEFNEYKFTNSVFIKGLFSVLESFNQKIILL
jgi:lisH domain-containing protein FOPNL